MSRPAPRAVCDVSLRRPLVGPRSHAFTHYPLHDGLSLCEAKEALNAYAPTLNPGDLVFVRDEVSGQFLRGILNTDGVL